MQRSFMSSALKKWKHQQIHIWKYSCIHSQNQRRQILLRNSCTCLTPCQIMSIGAFCCMCQTYLSMLLFPWIKLYLIHGYDIQETHNDLFLLDRKDSPSLRPVLQSIPLTVLCHDYKLLQALNHFQLSCLTQGEKSTGKASLLSHSIQKSQTLY